MFALLVQAGLVVRDVCEKAHSQVADASDCATRTGLVLFLCVSLNIVFLSHSSAAKAPCGLREDAAASAASPSKRRTYSRMRVCHPSDFYYRAGRISRSHISTTSTARSGINPGSPFSRYARCGLTRTLRYPPAFMPVRLRSIPATTSRCPKVAV